jgi:hypothetical protein
MEYQVRPIDLTEYMKNELSGPSGSTKMNSASQQLSERLANQFEKEEGLSIGLVKRYMNKELTAHDSYELLRSGNLQPAVVQMNLKVPFVRASP